MSLPGLLGTDRPAAAPAGVPYLAPDPALVERWRAELPAAGFRVGVVWRGNPKFGGDRHRSLPLERFVPLGWAPGVRLVSLQLGPARSEIAPLAGRLDLLDLGDRLASFDDTAAAVACLDLVIACDTSVAHLAGALGVPVWVALPSGSDWRWLRGRDDTPWYPSMRLYRQAEPGNWDAVFARMAEDLRAAAAGTRPRRATVCVMTAADREGDLTPRLGPILAAPPDAVEVRLGFDAAPRALAETVRRLAPGLPPRAAWDADGVDRFALRDPRGSVVRVWDATAPLGPWGLLRRLWRDHPPEGEYVVWVGPGARLRDGWWDALAGLLGGRPDYVGREAWAEYPPGWDGRVRTRPWFRDLPVEVRAGRPGVLRERSCDFWAEVDRSAGPVGTAVRAAWTFRGPSNPPAGGPAAGGGNRPIGGTRYVGLERAVQALDDLMARPEPDTEGSPEPPAVPGGLRPAHRAILAALRKAGRPLMGKNLAAASGYKPGTLRRHTKPLQDAKLIRRTTDGYALTPAGERLIDAVSGHTPVT